MLSYPLPEAEELLTEKLATAIKSRDACLEDLDFLREQITTMEVGVARVYNWDVGVRRKEKELLGKDSSSGAGSGAGGGGKKA
jgi:hypothetical protein